MEQEWFIGHMVKPKEGAVPAGLDPDDPEVVRDTKAHLTGKPVPITAGYHSPDDPHESLVFEAGGWWWYAHDLENDDGFRRY